MLRRPHQQAPLHAVHALIVTSALLSFTAAAGPVAAETGGGVTGTVSHAGATFQLVAGYAFPGLEDGSGAPPPMLFLTSGPLDSAMIAAKPHAGARTVEIARQAAAQKLALLAIWEESPGEVMVRFVADGDFFGEHATEPVLPIYAILEALPWSTPEANRLRGELSTEDAQATDGLAFQIVFDVKMIPAE